MPSDLPHLTQLAADAVGAAQRQLPPEIRALARGVAVHYEAKPDADVLADGFEPDILGLFVGNPYNARMRFEIIPMDPEFRIRAADAAVNFPELALAPGMTRQVIVTFRIDPAIKERTIGVCVQPKSIAGTVLPRVCGTYTGRLRG